MAKNKNNRRQKIHDKKRVWKIRRPKPQPGDQYQDEDLERLESVRVIRAGGWNG